MAADGSSWRDQLDGVREKFNAAVNALTDAVESFKSAKLAMETIAVGTSEGMPILIDVNEAQRLLAISRSAVYRLIEANQTTAPREGLRLDAPETEGSRGVHRDRGVSLRLHSGRTGGGRRRPPPFFCRPMPKGERYPHANISGACARVEERLPPFRADNCPRRISRHAKSPENRECVLGDFLGESGFRPEPFFPSRPGQRGTREKEKPPTFRVWGFGIGRSGGI